ncbi:uncharacterized protein LOC135699575 [Ochlerotatus camptorhynchus]|uniref:uncharacterized protein LOC135699575 n=1 Tax=Ochlerotatus camptorhynchus TaxID=644619 RepID=UPI0031D5C4A6
MLQRRSCTDACSHGTNSSCSYCSQHTNLSVSGSERDTDSSAFVCVTSGSALDSPVIVEVTGLDCPPQQQHQQSVSSNGPSFFGLRQRSHSSNCHTLSSDPEPEHDRDHDHESSFEWWFHRRKSSHKSRSRSSSHICGGTTGGSLPIRSSPVSSCCGSQGRSSPETMEQEIYGTTAIATTTNTTTSTTTTSASVRNGAMPSLYGPISPELFLPLLRYTSALTVPIWVLP